MHSFWSEGITSSVGATLIALCGALVGLWLTGAPRRARVVVPFSAGALLGVAMFGVLPEIGAELGWSGSFVLFAAGYLLLFLVNRYVYPVCPTCSHDHDHHSCATMLHGFAGPLVMASVVHSFFDGWGLATAEGAGPLGIRLAVPLAVVLHKIPEGIALGGMLRAAVGSRSAAFGWCCVAELPTIAGGELGLALAPHLSAAWVMYPLAIAGGCFTFLGIHAVHEEWKRRGPVPAFMPALTGAAGAAALQQGVRALLR